jgi:hypothetical protein
MVPHEPNAMKHILFILLLTSTIAQAQSTGQEIFKQSGEKIKALSSLSYCENRESAY